MTSPLAIATIAIVCVSNPMPTATDLPLARRATAFAAAGAAQTADVWSGSWQGTTVSRQPLVLELRLDRQQRLTGRLTVGKQSANITAGKVVGEAFALTTGPIDGHAVDATGRQVGGAIELRIDGVKTPLTLTRVR